MSGSLKTSQGPQKRPRPHRVKGTFCKHYVSLELCCLNVTFVKNLAQVLAKVSRAVPAS